MIFVLEIKGTAILVFEAEDPDEARAYADSAEVREELTELTTDGAPLWNGKDAIAIRAATEAETDLFEEARGEDWEEEPHADPEDFAVYLVPLDEPEDE
jgi:hypothetical protein